MSWMQATRWLYTKEVHESGFPRKIRLKEIKQKHEKRKQNLHTKLIKKKFCDI